MNLLVLQIYRGITLAAILWFSTCPLKTLSAQQPFSEGVLVYNVLIKGGKSQTAAAEPRSKKGTYRLIIKKAKVKKEFILEDGKVTRTSIADHKNGTRQVLREREGVLYVIETGLDTPKRNGNKSAFIPLNDTKTLNGYDVVHGTLRLENGQTIEGYVYPGYYLPYPDMLRRFDAIHGIPAAFTLTLSDGSQLQFELESIREEPVLNATFLISEDYRRISKDAYEKFQK